MGCLLSKSNAPRPHQMRFDVPEQVRARFLMTLREHCPIPQGGLDALLDEVQKRLLKTYGGLRAPRYEAARRTEDPTIEHFFSCNTDQALTSSKPASMYARIADVREVWMRSTQYSESTELGLN